MNCAEFQRRLLIDPQDPELADAARAGVCADGELQLHRALQFEARLSAALQVQVPADLLARIQAAVPEARPARPRVLRRAWALAASISLGVLVSQWWWAEDSTARLARACVSHLAHDPYALVRPNLVPEPLVQRVFGEFGVQLHGQPAPLQYSTPCKVGDYRALHMVARTASGPITVMYLDQPPPVRRQDFQESAVAGRIVPMGRGALVLLAANSQEFDPLEMRFRMAIEGPASVAGSR